MLNVEVYKVGPLETNCYLLQDMKTNKCAIVDPGGISSKLDKRIDQIGKENFEYILITHGHFDHIRKAEHYGKRTGARIAIGSKEKEFTKDRSLNLAERSSPKFFKEFEPDVLLEDGSTIKLGEIEVKVMHTPGHTIGGVVFLVDDMVFTGDTLMRGTIGNVGFKTGNMAEMLLSLRKLYSLKGDYIIYPGHGDVSNLNYEKQNNLYFRKASK